MGMKKLDVEVLDTLYDRFHQDVTEPGGIWRSKDKEETAHSAFQSAVEVALKEFLDSHGRKRSTK